MYERHNACQGLENVCADVFGTLQAPYVVFSEEQLRERQEEAVSAVTGVLSISRGEAVRVLRLCKW